MRFRQYLIKNLFGKRGANTPPSDAFTSGLRHDCYHYIDSLCAGSVNRKNIYIYAQQTCNIVGFSWLTICFWGVSTHDWSVCIGRNESVFHLTQNCSLEDLSMLKDSTFGPNKPVTVVLGLVFFKVTYIPL